MNEMLTASRAPGNKAWQSMSSKGISSRMGKQICRSALRARPGAATASRALGRVITISMSAKIVNVSKSDKLKPSESHEQDKKEKVRLAGMGVASVGPRYYGLMTMQVR